MKRIRDRPGKAGICAGRLAAKKKKRRRNDTKELLYMKKKGLAMFALAAVMSLGAVGITALRPAGHRKAATGYTIITMEAR